MKDPLDPFSIEHIAGSPPILRVVGEVDIVTSPSLGVAVQRLLTSDPGGTMILDLSGVGFIDSSGLAVMLGAVSAGSQVVLRAPSPAVRIAIEATGLGEILTVEG